MRVTVFLLRGDLKCGSAFGRSKLECFYVRSQARRFVRLVRFPRQEKYMAVNVSKVGYVKRRVFTWYHRIIQSAIDQKYTRGTMSSVGKNDYRCVRPSEL